MFLFLTSWLLLAEKEVMGFLYLLCSQVFQIPLLILMPFSLESLAFLRFTVISQKTFCLYFPVFKYSCFNPIFCSTDLDRASNKCWTIMMAIAMAVLFLILMEIVCSLSIGWRADYCWFLVNSLYIFKLFNHTWVFKFEMTDESYQIVFQHLFI